MFHGDEAAITAKSREKFKARDEAKFMESVQKPKSARKTLGNSSGNPQH